METILIVPRLCRVIYDRSLLFVEVELMETSRLEQLVSFNNLVSLLFVEVELMETI